MSEYQPPDNYTLTIDDICGKYDDEIFKLKEQVNSDAINLAWYQTHLESLQATVEQQAKEIESLKANLQNAVVNGYILASDGCKFYCATAGDIHEELRIAKAEIAALKSQTSEPAAWLCEEQYLEGVWIAKLFLTEPKNDYLYRNVRPLYLAAQLEGDKHECLVLQSGNGIVADKHQ